MEVKKAKIDSKADPEKGEPTIEDKAIKLVIDELWLTYDTEGEDKLSKEKMKQMIMAMLGPTG